MIAKRGKEKKLAELLESASKSRSVKSCFAKMPAAIHSTTASVATQLETNERFEGEFSYNNPLAPFTLLDHALPIKTKGNEGNNTCIQNDPFSPRPQ